MKMFTRNTAGRKLEKKDFFLVFNPAFSKSVTVENAQGALRGTGVFPLDMKAIPEHAFEPSKTSERELLPASDPVSDSLDSTVTLASVPIPTTDLPSAGLLDAVCVVVSRRCAVKAAKHEAVRVLAASKLNSATATFQRHWRIVLFPMMNTSWYLMRLRNIAR